ncbi:MAG: histidine kinase [Bacteroidales bacterium]
MADLIKNRWIRWASTVLLAILFRFCLDVVYSLMYRNYELFQPFSSYLFAILITVCAFESIYQINKRLDKKHAWNINPYKRFALQWSLSFATGLTFAIFIRWIIVLIFIVFTYVNLLDEIVIVAFVLVIVTALTIADLSMFLLEKWRFSLAELERFKKENAEFRFESLRAQVNPHFLFNSLNTLSSLIYQSREKAEMFVKELSDVYRYILEYRDRELVTLERELEMVRSYIVLIQLRFEQNLSISLDIKEENKNQLIAPLTLQMLIENAIKHNIVSKKKPLKVAIYDKDGFLYVENNLQKKDAESYSSKLGLINIKNRYGFLTDKKFEVIESPETFRVKIPLIENV